MIRNESEYKEAVNRLTEEKARLNEQFNRLNESGLSEDEIKRAMDPFRSFYEQLQEEVTYYEAVVSGYVTDNGF